MKVINLVHQVNMYKVDAPESITTDINIQEKERFGFVQRLFKAAVDHIVEVSLSIQCWKVLFVS